MLAFEALDNSPGPETGKPALGGKKKIDCSGTLIVKPVAKGHLK